MSEPVAGLWEDLSENERRQSDELLKACKEAGIKKPHMRSRRDGSAVIVELYDDEHEGVQNPLFGATSSTRIGLLWQLTRAAEVYKGSKKGSR